MTKTLNTISLFSSLFLILFSAPLFSYELRIPTYLDGIQTNDDSQKYITYQLEGSKKPIKIKPQFNMQTNTVESFLASLFWVYQNNKKKQFFDFFDSKSKKEMQAIPQKNFEDVWKVLSSIKAPYIDHYFKKEGGYFVMWNAENLPSPRAIFLKKVRGKFLISKFKGHKQDLKFQNIETFFMHRPLPVELAKIKKTFSLNDSKYSLSFKTSPERPWIFIFKMIDGVWQAKVSLKDNLKGKLKFDDSDPKENQVTVNFKPVHFTKGKAHKLLILNTNFPVNRIPQRFFPKANLIIK